MDRQAASMDAWRKRYGPVALVTGASEGIGAAFAEELARRGLDLVVVARRKDVLEEKAALFRKSSNIHVDVIAADLSTSAGIADVITQLSGREIGLLVAAAGFGTAGQFAGSDMQKESAMLMVNCMAVLEIARAVSVGMMARKRGGIILFGSIVGFQGVPNAAHYAATKAYAQTLAEGMHGEMRAFGVDVISCAPGPVNSGFARVSDMLMGKAVEPALVARATLAALGNRATVRPGFLSKLLGFSLAVLPRAGRSIIMGKIMGGMIRHRNAAG